MCLFKIILKLKKNKLILGVLVAMNDPGESIYCLCYEFDDLQYANCKNP